MDYSKVEKRIEEYVKGLFEQMHSSALAFHNPVDFKITPYFKN